MVEVVAVKEVIHTEVVVDAEGVVDTGPVMDMGAVVLVAMVARFRELTNPDIYFLIFICYFCFIVQFTEFHDTLSFFDLFPST